MEAGLGGGCCYREFVGWHFGILVFVKMVIGNEYSRVYLEGISRGYSGLAMPTAMEL